MQAQNADTKTQTERHVQAGRQTQAQKETDTDRQTYRETGKDRQSDREWDKATDRQTCTNGYHGDPMGHFIDNKEKISWNIELK